MKLFLKVLWKTIKVALLVSAYVLVTLFILYGHPVSPLMVAFLVFFPFRKPLGKQIRKFTGKIKAKLDKKSPFTGGY